MTRSLQSPAPALGTAQHGGRHRVERAGGVRALDLPGVREQLAQRASLDEDTRTGRWTAMWRWLTASAPAGRHTWSFLAGNGGRPRTAFAIILSL